MKWDANDLVLLHPGPTRRISMREVIDWARDRMIDNAIEVEHLRLDRSLTDEEVDRISNDVPVPTLDDAIERLQDDGVATFRRRAR